MAEASELTPSEYIQHHLSFFTKPLGGDEHGGGFWALNVDSLIVSILLGFVGLGLIWWIVRGATSGVPTKRQAFVELLIDFRQGSRRLAARACLRPLWLASAAHPGELPVPDGRVPVEDAVALAAALRQHVRRRDPVPPPLDVGGDRHRRHDLRLDPGPGLGDLPHPDRPAA